MTKDGSFTKDLSRIASPYSVVDSHLATMFKAFQKKTMSEGSWTFLLPARQLDVMLYAE